MNKVVEFLIKARDLTAGAINSAVARFKSLKSDSSDAGGSARKTVAIMQSLSAASDMAGESMGKFINGLKGVIGAAMSFGPVGAAVSVGILAINAAMQKWAEKQQEAIDKLNEWNEKLRAATERRIGNHYKGLAHELEAVATAADRASTSFERAAKAKAALDAKREGLAAARGQAGLLGMRRDMAADVAAAPDEEKNRVAAAWRLKIAEEEARLAERTAKEREKTEAHALETAQRRLDLAKRAEYAAADKAQDLKDEYERAIDIFGKDAKETEKAKSLYDAAQKMAESTANARKNALEDYRAAKGQAEVSALDRANEIAAAYDAAKEAAYAYDDAERKYADAIAREERERLAAEQRLVDEEERERLALEKRISSERLRLMRSELADRRAEQSQAEARLSAAMAQESTAWGWYRNRDSWTAQLAEERADAEAQKQFAKDFDRLRRFNKGWRTADNLSDEDELIRRVALAREERAAAEAYARQTAEAAERAADALDAIQAALTEEEG